MVVPAHNEQELLPSCLASLRRAAQALRGTPVHLIVVADACIDRTADVARRGGAAVVQVTARSVGAARAAGVREVLRRTTDQDPADVWVATTDADTVVPPGWLRQHVRYGNEGWDAVAGTIRVADWSGYRPDVPALFRDRYGTGTGPHPHVHGANLGFSAAAYLRAGGFPDAPTAEDRALVAALSVSGSRIRRTRSLTVVTSARREGRAPHGFSGYLADLDAAAAPGPRTTTRSGCGTGPAPPTRGCPGTARCADPPALRSGQQFVAQPGRALVRRAHERKLRRSGRTCELPRPGQQVTRG